MDVPIVISHRTAYALYHCPSRREIRKQASKGKLDFGVNEPGIKASEVIRRTCTALSTCGLTSENLKEIELLTSFSATRSQTKGAKTHTFGRLLTGNLTRRLAPGILVVCPELCYIQAATWLEPLGLIRFGFELCGDYELPQQGGYRKRKALTSTDRIAEVIDRLSGIRGSKPARNALQYVRDGSRSPMETALALMVVLPKRQGGLGYSDIAMNQRLDIPASLKTSMSSKYLEADLFSKKAGVAIEYDGENHGELKRRTHDADRTGALELMGYKVRTLTSRHFSGKLEMHRAMNGIAKMLGVRPDVSADFQERQSALRERLNEGWDVNGG